MKRLKDTILTMLPTDTHYSDVYEGKMRMLQPPEEEIDVFDPVYWYEDLYFEISRTNKLSLSKPTISIGIPVKLLGITDPNAACTDYCLRAFLPYIDQLNTALYNRSRPAEETGKYYVYLPNGCVLQRNCSYFKMASPKYYTNASGKKYLMLSPAPKAQLYLNLMIQVQLPLKKHRKSIQMLTKDLPNAVTQYISQFSQEKMIDAISLFYKQTELRDWLASSPYCSFIANGSILPRMGQTDLPLKDAKPFQSPLEHTITACGIDGMGIPRGVTVITGGGYSGKSTLLNAISAGIYNHYLGDGREYVITDDTAMTISAEDGRSIKHTNLSPFIKYLPQGDASDFSTEHASGSTSQAANIMEAIHMGCHLLLIDEDKSATNFMIQDKIMRHLIKDEPVTPFTDRVNELYDHLQVSTILVIGGSGKYLNVADSIFLMSDFQILDVTQRVHQLLPDTESNSKRTLRLKIRLANWNIKRSLIPEGFTPYSMATGSEFLEVSDLGFLLIGEEKVDVRPLTNIVTEGQLNAIGFLLRKLELSNLKINDRSTDSYTDDVTIQIDDQIDCLLMSISQNNLDSIFSTYFTKCGRWLELPRRFEILCVINRLRMIHFQTTTTVSCYNTSKIPLHASSPHYIMNEPSSTFHLSKPLIQS